MISNIFSILENISSFRFVLYEFILSGIFYLPPLAMDRKRTMLSSSNEKRRKMPTPVWMFERQRNIVSLINWLFSSQKVFRRETIGGITHRGLLYYLTNLFILINTKMRGVTIIFIFACFLRNIFIIWTRSIYHILSKVSSEDKS